MLTILILNVVAGVLVGGYLLYKRYKPNKEPIKAPAETPTKPVLTAEIIRERLSLPPVKTTPQETYPQEVYSSNIAKEKSTRPICMECLPHGEYREMVPAGEAFLRSGIGQIIPVTNLICPNCSTVCQYMHTPNLNGKEAVDNYFCFWTHKQRREEFRARVMDNFMPFKPVKVVSE